MRGPGTSAALGVALIAVAGIAAAQPRFAVETGPPELVDDAPYFDAYREFGHREGLPQATIYALAQDTEGRVWAGTEDGVAHYDGRRWQREPLPGADEAAPSYVYALAATDDGAVWIATDERGVFRHDATGTRAVSMDEVPGGSRVQGLARAGPDSVWAATGGGVFRCTPAQCTHVSETRGLDASTLAPSRDAQGAPILWIGTLTDGVRLLERIDSVAPELTSFNLSAEDGLPARTVRALAVWGGPDGRDLWIGTGFGFARLSGQRLVVYGETRKVTTAAIGALVPSRDARGDPVLLAALQRGGWLEIGDDGLWRRRTAWHGLPDEQIYSLLSTDGDAGEPRLWLGSMSTGVLRRERGRWHTIDVRHGLPHRAVRALGQARFPDGVDTYWISTAQGTVRLERGAWRAFGPEPIPRAVVYAVVETAAGTTWLGTDLGLVRWTRAGAEVIDRHDTGLPGNTVIALHPWRGPDGVEALWIGTRHGLARLVDGRFAPIAPMPAGLGPTVRSFVGSRDGEGRETLWAGGEGGVEGYDGTRWSRIDPACLPHPEVMDLRVRGEVLWIATRAGIAHVRLDATRACGRIAAPGLGVVYQIQFDRAGRLYAFASLGAARWTPRHDAPDDWSAAQVEHYGLDDGLPALEFNRATMLDAGGRIWGGTIAGAVVLDPQREPGAQRARPLALESAYRPRDGSAVADGAALPADDASIAFDYALLSFEREHLTRYRTELAGLDAAPGAWTRESRAEYARLPPGAYTFRVWARDAFGTVTGPREHRFAVEWPRWQQPWALVAYAGALLLAGLAAGRWRNRAIAARAALLEREIAERTRALEAANRRFEEASLSDALTGLRNRRYFGAVVADELNALAQRAAIGDPVEPVAVCLLDLDYFKSINDRYGHAAGDRVLQRVANVLRDCAGPGGTALRWGGEEFLLVLDAHGARDDEEDHAAAPSRRRDDAAALALRAPPHAARRVETVVEALRRCVHHVGGRELTVTASIGWAPWPWHPGMPRLVNLDQLLTLADQALYRAKEAGRNRAVGATCDDAAPPLPEHPELRVRWLPDQKGDAHH